MIACAGSWPGAVVWVAGILAFAACYVARRFTGGRGLAEKDHA